jgi:hypothetical protein
MSTWPPIVGDKKVFSLLTEFDRKHPEWWDVLLSILQHRRQSPNDNKPILNILAGIVPNISI